MAGSLNFDRSTREKRATRNGRTFAGDYRTIVILEKDRKEQLVAARTKNTEAIAIVASLPLERRKAINGAFKAARSRHDDLAVLSYGAWLVEHLPEFIDGMSVQRASSGA